MEDLLRFKDYQWCLDLFYFWQSSDFMLSEFKNLDIIKKKLVYEGLLMWWVIKDKVVEVYVLLLDDLLLLFQCQDEWLLFKFYSWMLMFMFDGKIMLWFVLWFIFVMICEVVIDYKVFYVFFIWDQEVQIYELVVQIVLEWKNWCVFIIEIVGFLKVFVFVFCFKFWFSLSSI